MKKILSLILSFTMAMLCFNVNMSSSNADAEPSITIADVTGNAGETVDVEVEISNNPGIIALSFDVEYDSNKLKLVKAEDKKILGTSTSVFGNDLSANPYRLCWDDLSDKNNEQNGVLATLTFEILEDATGAADIDLILNQGSTFNIDFEDVEFAVSGGKVQIGSDTTTAVTTTTKPTTTTTVINPTTDAMLSIADVTGEAGETVDVEVEISNNPGIIALSFDVEYDSSKLKLVKAEDKKILGTSTSVFGNDLSANPYRLCWDDLSDKNNEQNGVLATLTFEILEDATGSADIDLILNQGSTFNIDFEDVEFAVSGGKINIGTVTTTTTTKPTTTTTTTTTTKPTTTTTTTTTTSTTTTTTIITTTTVSTYSININKIDNNGTTVVGARLELTGIDDDGDTIEFVKGSLSVGEDGQMINGVGEKLVWISGTDSAVIKIEDGTYTLNESSAPAGYYKADSIVFVVSNGVITVNGKEVDSIDMIDELIPVTTTTTTVTTTTTKITTTTTVNPAVDAMLSIADVTGKAGETVDVDIEISNNPGIIAISFDVEYDSNKLKLVSATDKKLLGTSTSVFGKDLSANPYRLCWDDLSDSNNEQNGVLATLTFEILEDATGAADIDLILNQGSTFNIDFEDVEFAVAGGKVNIGESATTTTDITTTTVKPTTTTKTTITTEKPTTTTITATTTTTTTSTTTTATSTTTSMTTTTPPTTTEPAYLLGDVNEDGSVDSSDASLVLAEYAKIQTGAGEFTETQHKAADVNNDGVVDSSDASKILAYYAMVSTGKEPTWD